MFKRIKRSSLVAMVGAGMMMFAAESVAQQTVPMQKPQQQAHTKDYSEEEINAFVEGNKVVLKIQEESRVEMMEVVESQENISLETFNEIANSQKNPNASTDQYTEEQMAAFEQAAQKLMLKQQEMQMKMAQRLPEEADISFEKFQEMMMAYRQDPQMQEKVNAAMEEGKGGQK